MLMWTLTMTEYDGEMLWTVALITGCISRAVNPNIHFVYVREYN